MKVISIIILIATLVMVGWIAWTFVHAWMTASGSWWQKTLAAGKDSATIVWAKFVMVVGGIIALLGQISTVTGDPSFASQIQTYITPQYVGYFMVAIMVINVWARLRTL